LIKHICISSAYMNFCEFYVILWVFKRRRLQTLKPSMRPLAVDRPVDRAIDRCVQDVHKALTIGPVDCAVNRSRELALWIWPRSTDQRVHSLVLAPIDRTIDWRQIALGGRPAGQSTVLTVRNLTVGRSTGQSTDRSFWICFDPMTIFSRPYLEGLFHQDFQEQIFPSS